MIMTQITTTVWLLTYIQIPWNAKFQTVARRNKKAFLSDQCKEIEGNNRIGKTRDLFKKIRDNKGTFHAKMGSIKNKNGMDLTETEDIKKRWQEYTEELHMDITRWSTPKSDWLYSLQPKMEKLYTVNKIKTGSWLLLRSWTPYCQIQTEIEESRENR